MTDLLDVLPNFDIKPFRHLTHSLEKNDILVSELITLDPIDLAKRCPLPLKDLKAFIAAIIQALRQNITNSRATQQINHDIQQPARVIEDADKLAASRVKYLGQVRILDPKLDEQLGGGFYTSHVSEIVGERFVQREKQTIQSNITDHFASAVGKTQFVLGLLLAVQLAPPQGLGKSAIYLSTEAPVNTGRLHQMLATHPEYVDLPISEKPSLDKVHTIVANDLEAQEHIIRYQLPVAVERFNIGIIVMDSVAANFRAEHETRTPRGLADRAQDLMKLGSILRQIAVKHNVAVVVTNQVSDRFEDAGPSQDRHMASLAAPGSSPLAHRQQTTANPFPSSNTNTVEQLGLDYQQRFFTGWASNKTERFEQLKNPALGFAWANQLSARVVLKMQSQRTRKVVQDGTAGHIWKDKKKRRFLDVVFAPWTPPGIKAVEYEIQAQGPVSVQKSEELDEPEEHSELLDPRFWYDGAGDDEFP